jgi:hypothetical protein
MINLIAKISGNYILLWQLIPSGKWQEAITVATNILLRDRGYKWYERIGHSEDMNF